MNQEKDNRIPFDWELYQKGYEVEYRVGGKPLRIEHFHEAQRNSKIVSINYDGEVITHRINGMYSSVPMCDLDLLLIPPQPKPEPEMFVNVYEGGKISGDVHDSFDNAIKCKRIGADCIGTYKLVRIDEK